MQSELLMRGCRIIIPPPLRSDILEPVILASLNVEKKQSTQFGGLTSANSLHTWWKSV